MYELYQSVANIEVDGKRYDDICFRLPISDIFHTRRRRRRQATLEGPNIINDNNSTTVTDLTTEAINITTTTPGTTTTTVRVGPGDDWSDDLWADYDYDSEKKVEADRVVAATRIDFGKYGPRLESQKRVDASQVR
jgi:hypothetical protein